MPDRPRGIVQWVVAVVVLGPILAAAALADLLRENAFLPDSRPQMRRPHELPSGAIHWEHVDA